MKHKTKSSKLSVQNSKLILGALLLLGVCQTSQQSAQASPVVIYPVCNHKEADGANVGDHSNLCDANIFGNSKMAESLYGDLIFNRTEDAATERTKYVTQLYAFIKASARQFILKKEVKASDARINRFADDIMTIAYHESRLTHYAYGKDKRFKLMAADIRLVSRGLMQINQTFHASRDRDNSLDIYGNISLGMDMIYNNEKYVDNSISKGTMSCISKKEKASKGYEDIRLRAAWSAYNSGSEFCRFRRKDKWSANDKMFLADMTKGDWRSLISDLRTQTKIDVPCLANGDEFCALPLVQNAKASKTSEKVLVFSDASSCVSDPSSESTTCGTTLRISQCFGVRPDAVKISIDTSLSEAILRQTIPGVKIYDDRDELCGLLVPGLIKVGEFFSLKKNVGMYDEIDGKLIASLTTSAQVYQVIDYVVRGQSNFERFYKIASSRGHYGYINAGNAATFDSITRKVDSPSAATTLSVPVVGSSMMVTIQSGIKIYQKADITSAQLGVLSQNTHFSPEEVQIKGSDNEMFLKISSGDKEGYIYVGRTYLSNTLNQYVRIN